MINDFRWPKLNSIDQDNVNFQQNGATCQTSNEIIDLWGDVKEKVYANSPASIQDIKDGIREDIADIGQPLCDLIMENFIGSVGRAGHLPDVIFLYKRHSFFKMK